MMMLSQSFSLSLYGAVHLLVRCGTAHLLVSNLVDSLVSWDLSCSAFVHRFSLSIKFVLEIDVALNLSIWWCFYPFLCC